MSDEAMIDQPTIPVSILLAAFVQELPPLKWW